MHHPRNDRAALITDVPQTQDQEFDRRRKRYAIMMALRALCVIGAAVTYQVSIFLALALIAGGAALPWCAVLIANDRPAKKRRSRSHYVAPPAERQLPPGDDGRTIDG